MQSLPSTRTLLEYRRKIGREATSPVPIKNTSVTDHDGSDSTPGLLQICLKNTFVHFETIEEDQPEPRLTRKTRRCRTAPQLQTLDEAVELADTVGSVSMHSFCMSSGGEVDSSDDSPSLPVPLVSHAVSGLSDTDTFASTPTGSECDFSCDFLASSPVHLCQDASSPVRRYFSSDASSPLRRYLRQDADLNFDALGQTSNDVSEHHSKHSRPAGEASRPQVMLQVPVSEHHYKHSQPAREATIPQVLQVPQQNVKHSRPAGEASRAQVLVQVPLTLPVGIGDDVSDYVKATVEGISQKEAVSGVAETIFDVRLRVCIPSAAPRASPKRLRLAEAVPGPLRLAEAVPDPPVAAPKSTSVCCHWKNKGWCAYKDTCKFSHPENRRGVGSVKAAAPTRTRGGNRKDGRLSVL